jgi:glycosyltransferase involved in cell wall biosynthesis
MTEHPLVSILVPLYNKAPYVEETIRSALSQTYPSIEVIVIDDGSTDGSADVVAAIEDPRLQLIRRENRGANATRNELLELAQGEFIQYLDADDLIDATKTERQMAVFTDEVDAVACRVRRDGRPGDLMPRLDEDDLVGFLAHHGLITVAPLYRAEHLRRIGGWRVDLAASQEYELHLRLALRGAWRTVRLVDEPLASYRTVRGSTSGDDGRLYTEKARALRDLLDLSSGPDSDAVALALANASRHLARSHQFELARSHLAVALSRSPGSAAAFPRRIRWARHPTPLVALETADHFIRTRRRGQPSEARSDGPLRVLWLVPDFPKHDDDPSYVFLLNEARSLSAVPSVDLLVASFADHPHCVSGLQVVNLTPPQSITEKAGMLLRTGRRNPKLLWETLRHRSTGYPSAWRLDAVANLLSQHHADVVHSHFSVPDGTAASQIAHLHGAASVVSLRGVDLAINEAIGYGFRLNPRYDRQLRKTLLSADRVLVASPQMRQAALEAGARSDRLLVLPNAVSVPDMESIPDMRLLLGVAAGDVVIVSVGHLITRKGFDKGIEAIAHLRRLSPEQSYHYVVIGEGEERSKLAVQAAKLGVQTFVHLVGRLPQRGVWSWYRAGDVYWFLSRTEAFGNVVLEAFGAGLPIVGVREGTAGDLLHDDTAAAVVELEPESIARATLNLLHCPLERPEIVSRRAHILEQYGPSDRARRLYDIYLDAATRAAGPRSSGEARQSKMDSNL